MIIMRIFLGVVGYVMSICICWVVGSMRIRLFLRRESKSGLADLRDYVRQAEVFLRKRIGFALVTILALNGVILFYARAGLLWYLVGMGAGLIININFASGMYLSFIQKYNAEKEKMNWK